MDAGLVELLESLAKLPPIGAWVADAACRGQGEVFTEYPQRRQVAELVERTCQGCPVRRDCLAFADAHRVDGVWAGEWHSPTTGVVQSLEPRPVRSSVTCGTVPGYRRHLRQHEPPCAPCRNAHAAAARERKRTAA